MQTTPQTTLKVLHTNTQSFKHTNITRTVIELANLKPNNLHIGHSMTKP